MPLCTDMPSSEGSIAGTPPQVRNMQPLAKTNRHMTRDHDQKQPVAGQCTAQKIGLLTQ